MAGGVQLVPHTSPNPLLHCSKYPMKWKVSAMQDSAHQIADKWHSRFGLIRRSKLQYRGCFAARERLALSPFLVLRRERYLLAGSTQQVLLVIGQILIIRHAILVQDNHFRRCHRVAGGAESLTTQNSELSGELLFDALLVNLVISTQALSSCVVWSPPCPVVAR